MAKCAIDMTSLTWLGDVVIVETSIAQTLFGCCVERSFEGCCAHRAVIPSPGCAHLATVVARLAIARRGGGVIAVEAHAVGTANSEEIYG
jgi:hypothetical protein